MAQDPKKRQKSLERKVIKERQKRAAWKKGELEHRLSSSQRALYRASVKWPVHEVLIS